MWEFDAIRVGSIQDCEDDGKTTDYLRPLGNGSATVAVKSIASASQVAVTISPAVGNFAGQFTSRNYRIKISGVVNPTSVVVNNQNIPFDFTDTAVPSWSYSGEISTINVNTGSYPISTPVTVTVANSKGSIYFPVAGFPLQVKRLKAVKTLLDYQWSDVFQEDYESIVFGAGFGQQMTFAPEMTLDLARNFPHVMTNATVQAYALKGLRNPNILLQTIAYLQSSLAPPAFDIKESKHWSDARNEL